MWLKNFQYLYFASKPIQKNTNNYSFSSELTLLFTYADKPNCQKFIQGKLFPISISYNPNFIKYCHRKQIVKIFRLSLALCKTLVSYILILYSYYFLLFSYCQYWLSENNKIASKITIGLLVHISQV